MRMHQILVKVQRGTHASCQKPKSQQKVKKKKKSLPFCVRFRDASGSLLPSQLETTSPSFTQTYDETRLSGARLFLAVPFAFFYHCNLYRTERWPQHFLSVLLLISSPLDDTQPQQKVNSFARHCATGIAMFFSSLLLFFLYLLCSVLKYQGNNVLIYTTPSCEKSTNQTFALHLSLLHWYFLSWSMY